MKWFLIVSDLLIPMIILGILCYGILRQVAVYDVFVKGAKSGFLTVAMIHSVVNPDKKEEAGERSGNNKNKR